MRLPISDRSLHSALLSWMKLTLLLVLCASVPPSMAQLTVIKEVPPPLTLNMENLCTATITSPEAMTIWARGMATERTRGPVAYAVTENIQLHAGVNVFDAAHLPPLHETHVFPEFEGPVRETGMFPEGDYLIQIQVFLVGTDSLLGQGEIQQEVAYPQTRPISPPNGSELVVPNPLFKWILTGPVAANWPGQLTYQLRICEIMPGQTAQDAITSNVPWFERGGLPIPVILYPVDARAFESSKSYGWQVTTLVGTYAIGTSEIWQFAVAAPPPPPGAGTGQPCQEWQCNKCGKIWKCSSSKCPDPGCKGTGQPCQDWQCNKCGKIWKCSSSKCPDPGCKGNGQPCQDWQCNKCGKIWKCSSSKCPDPGCKGNGQPCQDWQCSKCGKTWKCSSSKCPDTACKGNGQPCQDWQCNKCGKIWKCSSNKCTNPSCR